MNGLVIRLFGLTGSFFELVYPLRWVNTVLGAVTVVLAVLLVHRIAGIVPAGVAGVVLAFDPFVLRQDGRVMIETPGDAVDRGRLARAARRADRTVGADPSRLAAGLLFGLAQVTKDMTAVSTVVPLLLAGWWPRRRSGATLPWATVWRVLLAFPVPYLVYLAVVAANGLLPAWFDAKVGGVLRLVGVDQATGFNAVPGADLTGRLIEMLTRFGTSYVLLGLGLFAGLAAAFSAVPARRLARAGRGHHGRTRHLLRRRRRRGGAVRLLRRCHLRARPRRAVGAT